MAYPGPAFPLGAGQTSLIPMNRTPVDQTGGMPGGEFDSQRIIANLSDAIGKHLAVQEVVTAVERLQAASSSMGGDSTGLTTALAAQPEQSAVPRMIPREPKLSGMGSFAPPGETPPLAGPEVQPQGRSAASYLPQALLLGGAVAAALKARSERGKEKKAQKRQQGARSATAGSLERGRSLTVPREQTLAGGLATGLSQAFQASVELPKQQAEQERQRGLAEREQQRKELGTASEATARAETSALAIAKMVSQGIISPDQAARALANLPETSGIRGTQVQEDPLAPLKAIRGMSKEGLEAVGLREGEKPETLASTILAKTNIKGFSPKTVLAARRYQDSPTPENETALEEAYAGDERVKYHPKVTGAGAGAGISAVQQRIIAERFGRYVGGPLTEEDLGPALEVGRRTMAGLPEKERTKRLRDLSQIVANVAIGTGEEIPGAGEALVKGAKELVGATEQPGQALTEADAVLQLRGGATMVKKQPRWHTENWLRSNGIDSANPQISAVLDEIYGAGY